MSTPPKGTPEYEAWAAQDKGPTVLVACWTVTAISTLFVAARLYVRGIIQRKLWNDDYLIILSLICGFISTAFSTVATSYGNGQHFPLLNTEQKQGAILWTTAAFCPGILSFGLPKLAVIALLTRIMNPSRLHWWYLWTMGLVCVASLLATVGVLLGQCTPARSLWNFSITEKTCFDKHILISYCVYAGSISAFVDIYLAIYPSLVLFKLQMPTKKKLALCAALGIGFVSGIVAIYKTTRIPSLGSPDFSYETSDLVIWTVIEGSTLIIASSIPVMQPLAEVAFGGRLFSSSGASKARRYYDTEGKECSGGSSSSRRSRANSRASGGSRPGLVTIGHRCSRPMKSPSLHDDLEMSTRDYGGGGGFSSSDEDILKLQQQYGGSGMMASMPSRPAVAVGSNSSNNSSTSEAPRLNDAIIQTKVFSVTYLENEDSGSDAATSASERWKPV